MFYRKCLVDQALKSTKLIKTLCLKIAQAVSHRPLIKETQVHSRKSLCWI